jgi:hypothetical protein
MKTTPAKSQNRTRTQNRPPAQLSQTLNKGLLGYATAASAAGVGLLAMVQPAEGKIVYTPSDIPITVNGPAVQLDFNHGGVADFSFFNGEGFDAARGGARPPEGSSARFLNIYAVLPGNSVGVITSFTKETCAAELGPGRKVGPGKNFQQGVIPLFAIAGDYTSPGTMNCPWQGNKGGFLGLKFVFQGQTHYGWAHITLGTVPALTGYAFESVPNTTILTGATHGPDERSDASRPPVLPVPQPASLGMLARGARGIAMWRRPEEMN